MSQCREYVCANCGGTFHTAATNEECLAEARTLFGAANIQHGAPMVEVCDPCYRRLIAAIPPDLFRRHSEN